MKRIAAAKVNLNLHVTGKRDDGYHELASLTCFTEFGDEVEFRDDGARKTAFEGAFAGAVDARANSAVAARDWFEAYAGVTVRHSIIVEKRLPAMAGLGGGTADCAAVIHGLCAIYNIEPPAPRALLPLGADVPICAYGKPAIMTGAGEEITPFAHLPAWPLLLVNPGIALSTKAVFAARQEPFRALPPMEGSDLLGWLLQTGNDLESAALSLAPLLASLKAKLRESDAKLVRMTGSGSTFFAIYESHAACAQAAEEMRAEFPEYWVCASAIKPSAQQPAS